MIVKVEIVKSISDFVVVVATGTVSSHLQMVGNIENNKRSGL